MQAWNCMLKINVLLCEYLMILWPAAKFSAEIKYVKPSPSQANTCAVGHCIRQLHVQLCTSLSQPHKQLKPLVIDQITHLFRADNSLLEPQTFCTCEWLFQPSSPSSGTELCGECCSPPPLPHLAEPSCEGLLQPSPLPPNLAESSCVGIMTYVCAVMSTGALQKCKDQKRILDYVTNS